ncbi:hypothetical protein BD770DRAFT_461381 [Pilaira anomala]|nr:hypothetical protein BD770DRAFT_461381 [Pilaira anomala]
MRSVIFLLLVLFAITATAFQKRDNVKEDDDCITTTTTTTTTRARNHRTTTTIGKTHTITTTSTSTITVTRTSKDIPTNIPFVQNGTCINCEGDFCEYVCHDKSCNGYCKEGPCEVVCYIGSALSDETLAIASLLMIFGLYLMVMGFPFFIVTIVISGLLIGCTVTWFIMRAAETSEEGFLSRDHIYWLATVGGVLLAGASSQFYMIAMYLLAGASGYLITIFVWAWKDNFIVENMLIRNIIGLVLGLIFMLALVFIEHATVIISTSFLGAFAFVCGLELLLNTGLLVGIMTLFDFEKSKNVRTGIKALDEYKVNMNVTGMLSGIAGLWFIAIVWQRFYNRGKRFGVRTVVNSNDTLEDEFNGSLLKKLKKEGE